MHSAQVLKHSNYCRPPIQPTMFEQHLDACQAPCHGGRMQRRETLWVVCIAGVRPDFGAQQQSYGVLAAHSTNEVQKREPRGGQK